MNIQIHNEHCYISLLLVSYLITEHQTTVVDNAVLCYTDVGHTSYTTYKHHDNDAYA